MRQWETYGNPMNIVLGNPCNVGVQHHSKFHVFPGAAKLWDIVKLGLKTKNKESVVVNKQENRFKGEFFTRSD